MEEEQERRVLLQRYRRDRRKLLEFLLSSGLIKELRTSSGPTAGSLSSIDFDSVSADYVLQRLKSDGVVDVTEATDKYLEESGFPVMVQSKSQDYYFLASDPDLSGSPPRRVPPPPPVNVKQTAKASTSSSHIDDLHSENVTTSRSDYSPPATSTPASHGMNSEVPPLGLPRLNTGLSDDDLRGSAYELLLASVFLSRVEINSVEDRKKERSSRFLSGIKSKRDKIRPQSQSLGRHSYLMDIVRGQMQISEAMDACIRRNWTQLAARITSVQIDLPQISLGLLSGIFKSDFLNEKSYLQWKNRQANILEELLCFAATSMAAEHLTIIRNDIGNIRSTKEWDTVMSPSERVAVLASIRQVAVKLSSFPGQFGIEGETIYWTSGYHLNIRLYEKLLFSVFDILDESQLLEEADEVLSLLKLTWSTLGITQRIHNALYGWVLFQQFVETNEGKLLENAVAELQKVQSTEVVGKEQQYISSLVCLRQCDDSESKSSLVQAVFLSISIWCDRKLQDYHLYFNQKPSNFKVMMAMVSAVGIIISDNCGEIKVKSLYSLRKLNASSDDISKKLKWYVKSSTEAAYGRVASKIDLGSKVERAHPLALLANELKLIAEREFNVFSPVFQLWCPESLMISVVLLHQFYGDRLRPFLKGVSCLSQDARSVLPAAEMLDSYLTELYTSSVNTNRCLHSFSQKLDHYKIVEVSKPIIIDWVISQHAHILEWTGRAFDIEDWEPLSFHQRQAASIVEVFRIIEETVDQLFGLHLPMDITHLQALLSIIFHSLDAYLQKMRDQLVEKNHLYPPAPPLTRYTETVIPVIKKKLEEGALLDEHVNFMLNGLTLPKLCIRLNTLQYILKQISVLEDGIRKSWELVRPAQNQRHNNEVLLEEASSPTCTEAVDALFATTFSVIKETAADIIRKLCDFTGARVVFWDLRDRFLFHLYRGDVGSSRLESYLPHIDTVLDRMCGLIDDTLRDLVVLSVCRASLEGYVWVLLDGGPSRAFSDSDVKMMEDDFNMLKEFFIADGEGLPRSLVEQEAKFVQQILSLYALQTETVIQMLMNASERISVGLNTHKNGHMHFEDAHILVRVLCHKKDREASKFLKRQYQLPMSSEYDDMPSRDSTSRSPIMSNLLERTTSFHWRTKGHSSFKSLKNRLKQATSEIRNMPR